MITAAQVVGQVTILGATEAEGKLLTLGAATDAQSARFRMLAGIGASVLVASLVAVGVKSSEMAANFQQAVNRLRTGAGDVTDSFATLSSGILKVSVATGILSGPLTKAMYDILSSGQRGAQAFSTLAAAAKGAVIEQANVVDVSDTLAGTMTNFGTKVFGAGAFMNGLITAVSLGRITLQNLSTAMGPIEPVARAMGISFSDLAAAMSTQTNAAIPAERAATGLRFMMQSLEVPTKKAKDAMTEWGLSSVSVANEMKVSLPGALQMIYDAAKKAGPEGSVPFNRAVSDMVGGQRSLGTFLALTGTHMKDFKTNANAIASSMKSGSGEVSGWALAQSNFNVIMDKAKASVEAAGIGLGLLLLPALGKLMTLIPPIVDYLSHFSEHANVLVPILAGIGTVLAVLVVPAIWSLAAGIIAATWPALAIGVAVAALVAVFMHFYETNKGFRAFIDGLVAGFKNALGAVGGFLSGLINAFTNGEEKLRIEHEQKMVAMKIAADTNTSAMAKKVIANYETQRAGILQKLRETHDPAERMELTHQLKVLDIQEEFQKKKLAAAEADKVKQLAKQKELHDQMIEAQKNFFQRFLDMLGSWIGAQFSKLGSMVHGWVSAIGSLKDQVGQKFSDMGTAVHDKLTELKNTVGQKFSDMGTAVHDKLTDIKNAVGQKFSDMGTAVHDSITKTTTGVADAFHWLYDHNTYVKKTTDAVAAAFDWLGTHLRDSMTAIKNTVGSGFDWLGTHIRDSMPGIKNTVGNAFDWLGSHVHAVMATMASWVGDRFSSMGTYARDRATELKNSVGGLFDQMGTHAHDATTSLWNNVTSAFRNAWGGISGALNGLWNNFSGWFNNLVGQATQWGANVMGGFISGFQSMMGNLGNALGNAAGQVANFLGFHSPTKEGPGRDADKWAPNFIRMYTQGLLAGIPSVNDALSRLMAPALSLSLAHTVSSVGTAVNASGGRLSAPANYSGLAYRAAAGGAPVINLNVNVSPELSMDGVRLSRQLMPHLTSAIRYNTSSGFGR